MANIKKADYWYDAQIRKYLIQFTRVFSIFSYAAGVDENGNPRIIPVPARYASTDRMVAFIQRNASENALLSVPMITCYLNNIEIDRSRTHVDEFVQKIQVRERFFDENIGEYTEKLGNTYMLERKMAVPINLEMRVDIWTSNIEQKLQLFEQICVLFNPSLDLQVNTNPFDWAALTIIEPTSYEWSSRSLPIGTESEIDIMSINVKCPVWINPPAKLTPLKVIERIVNNILDVENIEKNNPYTTIHYSAEDLMSRSIVTPGNHSILVEDNIITLLTSGGNVNLPNGDILVWSELIEKYGRYREGISEIRLRFADDPQDDSKDIRGVFYFHPEPNKLYWYLDPSTLPQNTLNPVLGIVNPHTVYPSNGLPPASTGQRYILSDEIGATTVGWGGLTAKRNDIIEYNGTNWIVVFNSENSYNTEFLINQNTNQQLMWNGEEWVYSVNGKWQNSKWLIFL